jgi:hypothetical protein
MGTDLGTTFGYKSWVAMPKWARRRSAKPILAGSSPAATSNSFLTCKEMKTCDQLRRLHLLSLACIKGH